MRKRSLMLILAVSATTIGALSPAASQAQQSTAAQALQANVSQGQQTSQNNQQLSVEKIMRDQRWIGVSPSNYRWSGDSKSVYFDWNPENKRQSSTYQVGVSSYKVIKSSDSDNKPLPS